MHNCQAESSPAAKTCIIYRTTVVLQQKTVHLPWKAAHLPNLWWKILLIWLKTKTQTETQTHWVDTLHILGITNCGLGNACCVSWSAATARCKMPWTNSLSREHHPCIGQSKVSNVSDNMIYLITHGILHHVLGNPHHVLGNMMFFWSEHHKI